MRATHRPEQEEISVVIQGPIVGVGDSRPASRLTERCIRSVREQLPRAEVILSTWAGADTSGLQVDRVITSEDPGAPRFDDGCRDTPMLYTAARQILSTRDGLRAAGRPYAMKLRSDMLLTGTGFLHLFTRYPERATDWRVFRDRIVSPTYFARNPHSSRPYAFHPSDWWQFGWTSDLLMLWDIPLPSQETARWYATRPVPASHLEPWALYRYTVEQYVWLSALRKTAPVDFDHKTDHRSEAIQLSERIIANNLILAEPEQIGIRFLKYAMPLLEWLTLYTHGDWERLYARYCAPAFVPGFDRTRALKRIYGWVVAPVHRVLSEPGASMLRPVVSRWRRHAPSSFGIMRRWYAASLSTLGRLVRG